MITADLAPKIRTGQDLLIHCRAADLVQFLFRFLLYDPGGAGLRSFQIPAQAGTLRAAQRDVFRCQLHPQGGVIFVVKAISVLNQAVVNQAVFSALFVQVVDRIQIGHGTVSLRSGLIDFSVFRPKGQNLFASHRCAHAVHPVSFFSRLSFSFS